MLPDSYPLYQAFGEQGNYVRKARTVGELPHSMREAALKRAVDVLGIESIQYGVPIYRTLGLSKSELEKDNRPWLRCTGYSLPLALFWKEEPIEEEV